MKQWLMLGVAIFGAILLVAFGLRLIRAPGELGTLWLFVLACMSIIAALAVMSRRFIGAFAVGFVFLGMSLYFFARAAGVLDQSWLAKIFGVVTILVAGMLIFLALPFVRPPGEHDESSGTSPQSS